jgi:uncharacterized repeat protein (TIGR01451 family)
VTLVRAPVLAIEVAAPAEAVAGRLTEVCLKVRNTGDVPERRVTVTLPIPAGVAWVSATAGGSKSDSQVTWEFPDLAPQASREVCATFTRREPGTLAFTASARGQCATAVQAQAETRVAGIPAVLLEVIDLEDPIEVGNPVIYEIKVVNQGSAPVTNLRLACALPEEQDFMSGTGPTPVKAEGRTVNLDPLAALPPKADATWRVTVKALRAGDVRFKVDLTSDEFKRGIEETESTQQY